MPQQPSGPSSKHASAFPDADAGLIAELKAVSGTLVYPSESDAPFDVFCWKASDSDSLKVTTEHVQGATIQEQSLDEFFAELVAGEEGQRFQQLRDTLEAKLNSIRVFRAGEVEVRVYLIGKSPSGNWAGLHTVSVET